MKPSLLAAMTLLVVAGCLRNDYEVELTPGQKSMARMLTVTRHRSNDTDVNAAEIARLAEEYQSPVPAAKSKQTYQRSFPSRMPNDVGGYGTYTRWDTPLGSVMAYVERFRGSDDISEILRRREAAVNRLTDIVLGWLEGELGDEPNWPKLRAFLDEQFRRDLINLGLYLWSSPLWGQEADATTVGVWLMQYLIERGYCQPEEIPEILRALREADQENHAPALQLLRRQISSRMGDDAPPPLPFLDSAEALQSSLSSYLATTDEYAELVQEQRASGTGREQGPPDPMLVVGKQLVPLVFGDSFGDHDRLSVTLKSGRPAFKTNGDWYAETQEIRWRKDRLPSAGMTPALLYAFWDEPNAEVQRRHFGTVGLEGQSLLKFCLWYHGLAETERQEWDAFVATLRPGPDLESRLKAFHFSHERADFPSERRLAKSALEELLPTIAK